MSSSTKSQGEVKRWHVILFVTIAGLLTLLALFASVRDLLLLPGQSGFPSVIHRWHEAQSGAFMTILLGGSLLALLAGDRTSPWGKCTHNAKGELCPSACRCAISQRSDPGQTKGESFITGNGRTSFPLRKPGFAHVLWHRQSAGPQATPASQPASDHCRLSTKRSGRLCRTGLHRERSFGTQ